MFIKPVNTDRVTRGFGGNGHNGIDYAAPLGVPVYAAADGVVAFEGWGKNHSWITWMGGISVLIKHQDCFTGYAHLDKTVVNNGQHVTQGQVIGYVGSTGNSTGPHLHFECLPLVPNFSNGYSGRIDPTSKLITGGESATVDRIKSMYWRLCGRDADASGIGHYTKQANEKGWAFVYDDLKNSVEGQRDWQWRNPDRVRELEAKASQVDSKDNQIRSLQQQLEQKNKEIEVLKKNPSHPTGIDDATKTAINETNAIVKWLRDVFSAVFNRSK